jgi:hypothetical protein
MNQKKKKEYRRIWKRKKKKRRKKIYTESFINLTEGTRRKEKKMDGKQKTQKRVGSNTPNCVRKQ